MVPPILTINKKDRVTGNILLNHIKNVNNIFFE